MRPRACVIAIGCCLVVAAGRLPAIYGAQASQDQRPIFRAGANLVTVDAYPVQEGKIVEGLTADDFQILEDGKPQKIEAIEFLRISPDPTEPVKDPNTIDESLRLAADPHNRVFVAFLDTHHVNLGGGYYASRPLIDTLERVLAPNDLFGVMTSQMRPQDLTLGRKTDTIDAELSKYWSWGRRSGPKIIPEGDLRRYCYLEPDRAAGIHENDYQPIREIPIEIVERSWEEQSIQALEDLSLYLGRTREARSAVLMISAGWKQFEPNEPLATQLAATDPSGQRMPGITVRPGQLGIPGSGNGPAGAKTQDNFSCTGELLHLARIDDRRRLRDLVALANRNNVTFYAVNPEGLAVFDTGDPTLNYYAMADANAMFNRVDALKTLADSTNGLAIVNTSDIAGGLRKVADELSAYYLLGYYSTNSKVDSTFRRIDVKVNRPHVTVAARRGYTANRIIDTSKPGLKADGAAEGAFGSLTKIPEDAELYATGAVVVDGLLVATEIPSRVSTEWSAGGEVTVTATSAAGQKLPPVTGKIEPGARGALVKVPLAATTGGPWRVEVAVRGTPGTLQNVTEIAVSPSALVGEPVIYRGAPGGRSAIRPVADMTFSRTERVHIEWPELKPLDQRTARLLGRNGQPLAVAVNVTERDQDGHEVLTADLRLGPLAPADYVVEIVVGAGTSKETKVVGFHVQ
jgi:VWFA-related protein